MIKKILNAGISAVIGAAILAAPASAAMFDFEYGDAETAGLGGEFYSRGVSSDEAYSGSKAYKVSGSGEIGFRLLGALDDTTAADSSSIYEVSAYVFVEKAAKGHTYAPIKAALTTPGGFVGAEKEFTVPVGSWVGITFDIVPQSGTELNTLTFSAAEDELGAAECFYIDDVAVEYKDSRFECARVIDFEPIGDRDIGYEVGGGANARFSEVTRNPDGTTSSKKVSYSVTKNMGSHKRADGGIALSLVAEKNANAAILITDQLKTTVSTPENIGKTVRIEAKLLVRSDALAGKKIRAKLGTSSYDGLWGSIVDKYWVTVSEHELEILGSADTDGYVNIVHEFVLDDTTLSKAQNIEIAVYNAENPETCTVLVDDIGIYVEK